MRGQALAAAAALLMQAPAGARGMCDLGDVANDSSVSGEIVGSVPCCHPWHGRLADGSPVVEELSIDATKLFFYQNLDVGVMNRPPGTRKLIISLEPCEGVVYLLVRRTRPCWPDPATCCSSKSDAGDRSTPPCNLGTESVDCAWAHFHSVLDGQHDAAPTFFEVPMESTKYYFSVFAPYARNLNQGVTKAKFRLMVTSDIGSYPRPGLSGRLEAEHVGEREVKILWRPVTFMPVGTGDLRKYRVYSTVLLNTERMESATVFVGASKVMNTVCGLDKNSLRYGDPLDAASVCEGETCSLTISNIIPGRRYAFNVVAESAQGLDSAYAGIITSAGWKEATKLASDKAIGLLAAITSTVLGVVLIGYIWIVKLYD